MIWCTPVPISTSRYISLNNFGQTNLLLSLRFVKLYFQFKLSRILEELTILYRPGSEWRRQMEGEGRTSRTLTWLE